MRSALMFLALLILATPGCATYSQMFVNASGQVIQCSSTGQGLIGMATASNAVSDCKTNMRAAGYIEIEQAGVVGITLSESGTTKAPRILQVAPSSPADLAGIQAGDLLVSVDGENVFSNEDARVLLFGLAGTSVTVGTMREEEFTSYDLVRSSYTGVYGRNSRQASITSKTGTGTDYKRRVSSQASFVDTLVIDHKDVAFACKGIVRITFKDRGYGDQSLEFTGIEGISSRIDGDYVGYHTKVSHGKEFFIQIADGSIYQISVLAMGKAVTIRVAPT